MGGEADRCEQVGGGGRETGRLQAPEVKADQKQVPMGLKYRGRTLVPYRGAREY